MRLGFWSRLLDSFLSPRPRSRNRRKHGRTARSGRPLYRIAGIESLEPRLDVASFGFDSVAGLMQVLSDSSDWYGISVGVWYGADAFATVNGNSTDSQGQQIAASAVQRISIELPSDFGQEGGSYSNDIDLEGTIDPAFSSLQEIDLVLDADSNGITASPNIIYDGALSINWVVNGGSGDNVLYGGESGHFTLNSGGGTNTLYDGGGVNTLNGGGGVDTLVGGGGGTNVLNGGVGTETLYGGSGSNILNDGGGTNTVYGPATLNSSNGLTITSTGSGYNVRGDNAAGPITLTVDTDTAGHVTLTSGNNTFIGAPAPLTIEGATHLSLVKTGDGPQTLGASGYYDGGTTIVGGTLVVGSPDALPVQHTVTLSGGTLDLAGQSLGSSIALAGTGGLMNSSSTPATFAGLITGSVTLAGSGTTSITNAVEGTLIIGNSSALPEGSTIYCDGGTVDLNGQSLDSTITLAGTGTLINSNSTPASFAGQISGAYSFGGDGDYVVTSPLTGNLSVSKIGAGTVMLTATNTYTGGTTISDGALALGADGAGNENVNSLGAGPVTISGGQLRLGGSTTVGASYTIPNAITLDGGGIYADSGVQHLGSQLTIGDNGGSITTQFAGNDFFLDGGMTGSGSLGIDNQTPDGAGGLGAVHFGASSSAFTGTLTVNAPDSALNDDGGLVEIDSNSALQGATVEMDGGHGTIFANGVTTPQFGDLNGSGNINLTTADNAAVNLNVGSDNFGTTYSGVLSGPGSLTKIGGDTLTLTGVNTFTGGTDVEGGSIRLSDNNHQILNPPPAGSNGFMPADISGDFNIVAVRQDGQSFTDGGIDGHGLAVSETALNHTSFTDGDLTFNIGSIGGANAVQANGQDLNIVEGSYSKINVLATAVNGSVAPQVFRVNYTDGSSVSWSRGITDWTLNPAYGETQYVTMDNAVMANGASTTGTLYSIWVYSLPVDPTKTVSSVTLPDSNQVIVFGVAGVAPTDTPTNLEATPEASGTMHLSWTAASSPSVFGYNIYRGQTPGGESSTPLGSTYNTSWGATTFDDTTVVPDNTYYYTVQPVDSSGQPTGSPSNEASAATPTPGPLAQTDITSSFNAVGVRSDGSTFSGGLDGSHAISATILQQGGLSFLVGQTGAPDVVKADGQTINLPQDEYTQLQMLATTVNSDQSSVPFTVSYTDGTADTFTQSMSKWDTTASQFYSGETAALTMPYVNVSGSSVNGTYRLYSYSFNLASSKTVQSITLPNNSNVFILGINCETANLLPTGTAVTIAAGAALDLNGTNQQVGSLGGDADSAVILTGATLAVASSSPTTFAGTFVGDGGLTINGSGTLTLTGSNDFTGVTTVSNGTLNAGATNALSPNSSYVITGTGQINLNGYAQITPPAPTNLIASRATASEVDLTWAGSQYATDYRVEYQASGANGWTVFGAPTVATNSNVIGLAGAIQYAFRVTALGSLGNSSPVTTVCTTTTSGTRVAPTIDSGVAASSPATTANSWLFVGAQSNDGLGLTYAWSATSVPDGASSPIFTDNGTSTAHDTIAKFSEPGDYTFQVVVTDSSGLAVISAGQLTVAQTATSIQISPSSPTLLPGATQSLGATVLDQFGNPIDATLPFTWSVADGGAGGSIDSTTGAYTAPSQEGSGIINVSYGDPAAYGYLTASTEATMSNYLMENPYRVTLSPAFQDETAESGIWEGGLSVIDTGWINASSPADAVIRAVSGSVNVGQVSGGEVSPGVTFSFPADLATGNFSLEGLSQPGVGQILMSDGEGPGDIDFHWDVTVEQKSYPPIAVNDTLSDTNGGPLNFSADSLLGNDINRGPGSLSVYSMTDPAHGRIQDYGTGAYTYTPDPGFSGLDTFTYVNTDGMYQSNAATVTINVKSTVPIARNDAYLFHPGYNSSLFVDQAHGLLANDSLQGDGVLTVDPSSAGSFQTSHGYGSISSDGTFYYTPNRGFHGVDSFTYKDTDGNGHQSNTATVTIDVQINIPKIDLLDDANNDGLIDSTPGPGSDEALKNTDPGKLIVVTDPKAKATDNADLAHLAEVRITLMPDTTGGVPAADLTGWSLTLAPRDESNVLIWGKPDKTDPYGASKSWDMDSSGSFGPTSVYVEVTKEGTQTMQLVLKDADGAIQREDTVKITTQEMTIVAKTIDGANPDGSPHVSGDLTPDKVDPALELSAYVPVDNEDQDYIENGHTLVPNSDQTSRTIKNDWSLLPIVVTIPHPDPNGAHILVFPQSFRVFTGQDAGPATALSSGSSGYRLVLSVKVAEWLGRAYLASKVT